MVFCLSTSPTAAHTYQQIRVQTIKFRQTVLCKLDSYNAREQKAYVFRRRRWQIYLQECSLLVQEDQSKWRQENSKFKSWVPHILGDPGAVSRAALKGATKVFKHGRKSPWVPTLTGPFPNGQENAGSWLGAKNALYYCAQSPNSFSWVLFVSSYTTEKMWVHSSCDVFVVVSCLGILNSPIFTKAWSMQAWIPVVNSSLYFVTSPTWGHPPPCKQALKVEI